MKLNKLKLFGLAALLSANLSAKAANQNTQPDHTNPTNKRELKQDTLTIRQMEDFINEADLNLAKLRQKIRNPLTSKQDYYDAYAEFEDLETKRDYMQKRLEAARNGTTYIATYDTIGQNMTIEQMQQYLEKANKDLKKLIAKVDSPKISSEEHARFYEEYKTLKRNIKAVKNRLEAARRGNTISFNTGRGNR